VRQSNQFHNTIYGYLTPPCCCVETFLTTCRIDIAKFGNYEIHSIKWK